VEISDLLIRIASSLEPAPLVVADSLAA
jgi:hypothetical protein